MTVYFHLRNIKERTMTSRCHCHCECEKSSEHGNSEDYQQYKLLHHKFETLVVVTVTVDTCKKTKSNSFSAHTFLMCQTVVDRQGKFTEKCQKIFIKTKFTFIISKFFVKKNYVQKVDSPLRTVKY